MAGMRPIGLAPPSDEHAAVVTRLAAVGSMRPFYVGIVASAQEVVSKGADT